MTDQEINITVAKLCRKKVCTHPTEKWERCGPDGDSELYCIECKDYLADMRIPKYANDLNAMHEAVERLIDVQKVHWVGFLYQVARKNHYDKDVALSTSTARQRAEAFIKTLAPEKWRDA